MPQEQLRNAIDALRERLQHELEAQLTALTERQEQAIEEARRAAETAVEQRWVAKAEGIRAEWTARLESDVAAARAEAERRIAAEVARVRTEAERTLTESAARVRAEAEQASAQLAIRLRAEAEQMAAQAAMRVREEAEQEIESERQRGLALLDEERARASADLDAERQRAAAALDAERQRAAAGLDAERQRLEVERQAERQRGEADRQAERQRFDTERQQFRSERQRFEAERQQFALERERLEARVPQRSAADEQVEKLDADLRRLQAELAAERQQLQQVNEALRVSTESVRASNESLARLEAVLDQERQGRKHDQALRQQSEAAMAQMNELTNARAAERDSQLVVVERLFDAMRSMDSAQSLTAILTALVEAAGHEAPRSALFVANGEYLQGLKSTGFAEDYVGNQRILVAAPGMLAEAMRRGEAVSTSDDAAPEAPEFAALPDDCAAIAVPITIGGEPVALLYADDGGEDDEPSVPASWPEAVQILASHAASCLAHVTAARTAQAAALMANTPPADDDSSAKRYARLLVSEIKLYNEAAVRVGRENRDLLSRLRPEIERARKLYEERVPVGGRGRDTYFHQELVQTLADGDAALLGNPA